ncbi:MFS transporter [Leucobacter sp. GX24907]
MTIGLSRSRETDRAQRRIVAILALSTILGGLGIGASFSVGALLIVEVTGSGTLSGLGATMSALGAATAGIPLARFAAKRGRRISLATGNLGAAVGALTVIAAAVTGTGALLFLGLGLIGIASAVQLQARFAAADLARPEHRARDLSLVVWAITVGAVAGPNLAGPGEVVGAFVGIPALSGVFVFVVASQLLSAIAVWGGLRPDPLIEARRLEAEEAEALTRAQADGTAPHGARVSDGDHPLIGPEGTRAQFLVIGVIALSHTVMVGLMAMTPLHLVEHGGSITLVGVTISLHIAGMYALSPLAGAATGRFGAVPVMWTGVAVLALAAVGTAIAGDNVPVVQTALVLLGVGWCAATVAGAALLTDLTPSALRPRRQGQSDTAMNAAGALFGAASGALFTAGGFPVLSLIAGAMLLTAAMAILALGRVGR